MKRILITGVSGFLGTSLVRFFSGQRDVLIFGHGRNPSKIKEQLGDQTPVLLSACIADTLNENKIDTVIHLAGIAHDLSNEFVDDDYDRVNFQQTIVLYQEFLKSDAHSFIFLSSIKAVADHAILNITEDVVAAPETPYGKSKRKAEEFMLSSPIAKDKRFYIFRPCLIHGPGNKGNLNLLYRFTLSGWPWPLGAFENQRSFLSIDNFNFIVDHFVRQDIASGIFNLADDESLSTNELYRLIASTASRKAKVWRLPKQMIKILFVVLGRTSQLEKLTENMTLSNAKVKNSLASPLPVDIRSGISKTITSFHE